MGFVSVPEIEAAFVPAAPPVIPPVTAGAGQVYVVPDGTVPSVPLAGDTVNGDPLHTVLVRVFIAGVGVIVIVVGSEVAEHRFTSYTVTV